jgi:hypothetical protein
MLFVYVVPSGIDKRRILGFRIGEKPLLTLYELRNNRYSKYFLYAVWKVTAQHQFKDIYELVYIFDLYNLSLI